MQTCEMKYTWLGLELKTPFILASLTLFSHIDLARHIQFYLKGVEYGAGAVVLPSVNPRRRDEGRRNEVCVEVLPVESGVGGYMGFTVLGPTHPNIISVDYGMSLAEGLIENNIGVPVLGSVANMGNADEIIEAVRLLAASGIDGIELNFSCPNVLTDGEVKDTCRAGLILPSPDLLQKIGQVCQGKPVSLKISPTTELERVCEMDGINGLTLSNAYTGLVPPELKEPFGSPFDSGEKWCPTGIYGPQERLLTYYKLYKWGQVKKEKGIDVSCVGGIVTEEQAVQALLLGADTVQLSSVIAWKGLPVFKKFTKYLEHFLAINQISDVEHLRGISLSYIKNSADSAVTPLSGQRKMKVDPLGCKNCHVCICCEGLCIAISRPDSKFPPAIDEALCSGCGWCKFRCPHRAISDVEKR